MTRILRSIRLLARIDALASLLLATMLLVFVGAARAEVTPLPDNPYVAIVSRNVFGLVPIPTNAPVDPTPAVPPPSDAPNWLRTRPSKISARPKVSSRPYRWSSL